VLGEVEDDLHAEVARRAEQEVVDLSASGEVHLEVGQPLPVGKRKGLGAWLSSYRQHVRDPGVGHQAADQTLPHRGGRPGDQNGDH
jgi:hypothetical protein